MLTRPQFTKKRVIITCIIIVVLAIATVGGVYAASLMSQFNSAHVDLDKTDKELGIQTDKFVDTGTDITNIALYGVDANGTSDSIMIISVDRLHSKIKLTSLLRDSLVKVEPDDGGSYYTKINEAYGAGGPSLALKTLNTNYGLNVPNYASIKFEGMVQIIDAVGGIDLQITEDEKDMINGIINTTDNLTGPMVGQAGAVHLNGNQSVAYSRIRKVGNADGQRDDYGRTDRQRAVMEQLFHKALSMDRTQYLGFAQSILPYLETSLSIDQILDLAGILSRDNIQFEQTRVPMIEYTINAGYNFKGKSTVYYNVGYAGELINAFIYDDIAPETYIAGHPPLMTGALGGANADGGSDNSDQEDPDEDDSGGDTNTNTYSNTGGQSGHTQSSTAEQPTSSNPPEPQPEPSQPSEPAVSQPADDQQSQPE